MIKTYLLLLALIVAVTAANIVCFNQGAAHAQWVSREAVRYKCKHCPKNCKDGIPDVPAGTIPPTSVTESEVVQADV